MKTKHIIIAFAALLLIGVTIALIRVNNANRLNERTELSDLRRHLVDSLQSANNNTQIDALQSQKDSIAKIAKTEKQKAIYYKNSAITQKHISDSLQKLIPETDTICLEAINSKQIEISQLNNAVNKLEKVIVVDSVQLSLCEQQNVLLNSNVSLKIADLNTANKSIEKLTKSNKRNWFERNAIWIGIVSGSAATVLILKSKKATH